MRIGILPTPNFEPVQNRLVALGLPRFTMDPAHLQELTAESTDVVYVLPTDALLTPDWNQLRVRLARANRQFVMAGSRLTTAEIMGAVRDGASDVVDETDDNHRWHSALQRAAESQKLWMQLYGGNSFSTEQALSGASPAIRALRQAVEKLGPTDVNVLVLGESGVGKEKVAQALHQASRRKNFVALNCAAIPKDLLEAEIFGVERGAFTGAVKARAGLVEQAADGTLFLDEIGEMDISLQPKLLRFLETRIARRVGSETEYKSSARVVSATNRYLRAESEAGRFRLDLYYRLAEISLSVPPLRERREDIAPLAHIFLRQANERFGKNIEYCEPELIQRFMLYDWPGNARELKSTIDRLVLLYDGPVLRASWWELAESGGFRPTTHEPAPTLPASPAGSPPATSTPVALNRQQKYDLARRLLAESANNYTWVASQLGVNSSTLWRWRHLGKI